MSSRTTIVAVASAASMAILGCEAAPLEQNSLSAPEVIPPVASMTAAIQVTPSNLQGWIFVALETGGTLSLAELVPGPSTPPLGVGSLHLAVDNTQALWAYVGNANRQLSSLAMLQYSTYTTGLSAPFFAINVDYNVVDADATSFQGRIYFDPALNGDVVPGAWQTWDMTRGVWYASFSQGLAVCPKATPCSFSHLLSLFPNIGVNGLFSAIMVASGDSEVGVMSGYADALTFGTDTYDFDIDDPDNDGVIGVADFCPSTSADSYKWLGINRWVWNGANWITGREGSPRDPLTMEATRGCSCNQIVGLLSEESMRRYGGQLTFGCSRWFIEHWIASLTTSDGALSSNRSLVDLPTDTQRALILGP